MWGPLASPRRRRRLGYVSLVLVPLVAFGVLIGLRVTQDSDPVPSTGQAEAPILERPAQPIRVTSAVRRQLDRTIDRFLHTAVVRKNLDEAWELASPALRASTTREEWNRGDMPVFPYPAGAIATSSWKLVYADEQSVGVDVLVVPKLNARASTMVYAVQLTPRESKSKHWLVDYWIPRSTLVGNGPPPTAAGDEETPPAEAAPAGADEFDKGQLSPKWFLVPAAILALLLLTPVVIAVRGVMRNRRAERLYREHRRG